MTEHRRHTIALAIVTAILLLPCGLMGYIVFGEPEYQAWKNAIPFDSEEWKADQGHGRRLDMLADLFARHRLEGMTIEQVEKLLGKPSHSDDPPHDLTFYYHLGPDQYTFMAMIDDAILFLCFHDGRVVRVGRTSG